MLVNAVLIVLSLINVWLVFHMIVNFRRLRRVSDKMENMYFELDKLNFRLFVTEKKQKILQEKKIC